MRFTFHLEFDPYNADHRRAAEWLAAQPDPAEALVRMLRAAGEVERRLQRWEELAAQLASELHKVRLQVSSRPSRAAPDSTGREDPESARKIDTLFR